MDEIMIVNRIRFLRRGMNKFKGKNINEFNKADSLDYYCTLSRIDELMDLLPAKHCFRRESEEKFEQ